MIKLYESTCCKRKVPFRELATVEKIAREFKTAFYICPFCSKFHMTTKGKEVLYNNKFVELHWDNGDLNVIKIPDTSFHQYEWLKKEITLKSYQTRR